MKILYFVRHAESEANAKDILASQIDFPLSNQGKKQAHEIALKFKNKFKIDRIISSPLLRAKQTAGYFSDEFGINLLYSSDIVEQNLGRFSGMTYGEIEKEKNYCHDRTKRWTWIPDGGGESYEMIAERVKKFFKHIDSLEDNKSYLVVTHAVTMRLIHSVLTSSLPEYPSRIATNGEIWNVEYEGLEKKYDIKTYNLIDVVARKE